MKKIIYTIGINLRYYFLHFLFIPIIISILLILLSLVLEYKRNDEKSRFGDFLKKNILKKTNLSKFCLSTYFMILYHSTVTNRILTGQTQQPLKDVFGGWFIVETTYFYDFSALWNIVMFLPLSFLMCFYLKVVKEKSISSKQNLCISTSISFGISLLIELSQLFFKAGTFQISDLVYNTLGGLIGAILYILINKKIKQKKAT